MQTANPEAGAGQTRSRKDALGEATRAALIEKAEALFAEKGIDGVSIRQIGIAIGSSNSNVVGYHFGTKEALVQAILLRSRPEIETRRAELLARARREGRELDLPTLLDALCRPVFERKNPEGRHTYALFIWHVTRTDWWTCPANQGAIEATQQILQQFSKALPQLTGKYFSERMQAVGDIISGVLLRIDANREDEPTQELLFDHALRLANAVLTAPLNEQR